MLKQENEIIYFNFNLMNTHFIGLAEIIIIIIMKVL